MKAESAPRAVAATAGAPATPAPDLSTRSRRFRHLRDLAERRNQLLALLALGALAAGGLLVLAGESATGEALWGAAVVVLSLDLAVEIVRTVVVKHQMGVDTIALVAMVGSLALGEELAGLIVGVMFTGGATIEDRASARARRELTKLIQRAPSVAQRRRRDGDMEEVPVGAIERGETIVVRAGEVVAVDGTVISEEAVIDTSSLSGEPLPATVSRGGSVMSGTANAGGPFELRADRPAAESAYAALVRLVEQAQTQRAPFVRMADRYAGFFLPATLLIAGAAWAASGESVRALAVVVVATPCPLILAAPIALVSGVSRAAKAGVIVKGAGVIETLGQARTVLFDKTGTLTVGTPAVREVLPVAVREPAELLRLAASLDRMSAHVLGEALVLQAEAAGLALVQAAAVEEEPGQGIRGQVAGHIVALGSRAYVQRSGISAAQLDAASHAGGFGSGEARVFVAVDGSLGGVIVMADELRPDAETIVEALRDETVRHIALVSGDRRSVAERIGSELGVDRVYAEQSPEQKLAIVQTLAREPALSPVVMVGDGVNDAPALALADVGIAMGTAGATVASETADAVIAVDRIDRVADAIHAGRRALHIARQSVLAGMGLSVAAMVVAAAGYLPPVAGALLQEGIDLAVILNALRALRG